MITPAQYRETTVPRFDKLIEQRIDFFINKHADEAPSEPIRIATCLLVKSDGVTQADFERVLNKYALVGWKVQYVMDPRDGDYVELTL